MIPIPAFDQASAAKVVQADMPQRLAFRAAIAPVIAKRK